MGIPRTVVAKVWVHRNGEKFHGECHGCRVGITVFEHSVCRLVPQPKGTRDDISNLATVCRVCFRESRDGGLIAYMTKIRPETNPDEVRQAIQNLDTEQLGKVAAFLNVGSSAQTTIKKKECPRVLTRGPRAGHPCGRPVVGDHQVCPKCKDKVSSSYTVQQPIELPGTSQTA